MTYASRGIIPDDYWMHDVDLKNNYNESIRIYLRRHNYLY